MVSNKEIQNIWLCITNRCNANCSYCFKNNDNQIMDWEVIKASIDLCVNSIGTQKRISLYGGEPLFAYESIVKIKEYTEELAKQKNKEIEIFIISNGSLLDEKIIDFLQKSKIIYVLSIDGEEKSFYKNRTGNYKLIENNARKLATKFDSRYLSAQIVVCPNTAAKLFYNYLYLINSGFKNINIDPVQGFYWDEDAIKKFVKNIKLILKYIELNVAKGNSIFLRNSVRLIQKENQKLPNCPFYSSLYVAPLGDIYLCAILMDIDNNYSLGNIKEKAVITKYQNCTYQANAPQCNNCKNLYCHDYCHCNNFLKQEVFQYNKNVFFVYDEILNEFNSKLLENNNLAEYLQGILAVK